MHVSNRVLATALCTLTAFASAPTFAGVLTVAPTGANYTQIQAAVDAAASEDVILISPGSYTAVTIDGKSVTLLSTGAGNVTVLGTTTVKNLTATQRVILSGIRGFGSTTFLTGAGTGVGLFVSSNYGHVRVESCKFYGAIGWGDNTTGVGSVCCGMPLASAGRDGAYVLSNSQGVAFTACELQGGRAANALAACVCGNSLWGGDGLRVQSTLVSLYDCLALGGRGGDNGSEGGAGGAGCRTIAGTLPTGAFASGSTFRGANGGDAWDFLLPVTGGAGGTGMLVGPSTGVRLLGNTFSAGAGGISYFGNYPPGAPGTQLSGGGSIFTDPESRLVMTTDRFARAGTVVNVRIQGTPGQVIHLLVSRAPTFMILPSWRGTLVSLPGKGSVDVPVGAIPANGVLQTRYQVPPIPGGATSATVFMQAYRFDAVLGPKLAAGTTITLLH
ncbi:MAG: hypothetical protein JNL28_06580 [Planctomycetes bacterium]|nr:hypothetical protein [Planctomycetota bacterium]